MNREPIEGQQHQAARPEPSTSGRAAADRMKGVASNSRTPIVTLRARYGVLEDDDEKQIDRWMAKLLSRAGTNQSNDGKINRSS